MPSRGMRVFVCVGVRADFWQHRQRPESTAWSMNLRDVHSRRSSTHCRNGLERTACYRVRIVDSRLPVRSPSFGGFPAAVPDGVPERASWSADAGYPSASKISAPFCIAKLTLGRPGRSTSDMISLSVATHLCPTSIHLPRHPLHPSAEMPLTARVHALFYSGGRSRAGDGCFVRKKA